MLISRLPEFIPQGHSIPEIISLYESDLRKSEDFKDIAHAGALKTFKDLMADRKFLTVLRRTYDNLYQILEREVPHLLFSIEGRRKSLISAEEKLCKLLSENQSLDLFRDAFAFRIVIFGAEENSMGLIEDCYELINKIIQFFVGNGCTLCEEDPVVGTMDPNSEISKEIIIPKASLISKAYLYGVKDYILHPKVNGYQSLHCVFRAPSGYCFEVQVRTLGMHVYAVDGNAEHTAYKNKKYVHRITFDRNNVHIPGYNISSNGTIFDFVGLEKPVIIFHRQKTFV